RSVQKVERAECARHGIPIRVPDERNAELRDRGPGAVDEPVDDQPEDDECSERGGRADDVETGVADSVAQAAPRLERALNGGGGRIQARGPLKPAMAVQSRSPPLHHPSTSPRPAVVK